MFRRCRKCQAMNQGIWQKNHCLECMYLPMPGDISEDAGLTKDGVLQAEECPLPPAETSDE